MDFGWVRPAGEDRWVLLNKHGDEVEDVRDLLVALAGLEVVNRTLVSDGLPPLPFQPDLACVLARGPHDGRWVFLGGLAWPPESLAFAVPAPVVAGKRFAPSAYDRYALACQDPELHITGRPYRYRWQP